MQQQLLFLSFLFSFYFLVLSDDIQKVSTLTMTMTVSLILIVQKLKQNVRTELFLFFHKKHPEQALKKLAQFLQPEIGKILYFFWTAPRTQMLYV